MKKETPKQHHRDEETLTPNIYIYVCICEYQVMCMLIYIRKRLYKSIRAVIIYNCFEKIVYLQLSTRHRIFKHKVKNPTDLVNTLKLNMHSKSNQTKLKFKSLLNRSMIKTYTH